jgi:hypothetical protein
MKTKGSSFSFRAWHLAEAWAAFLRLAAKSPSNSRFTKANLKGKKLD